jgi:hypothetical protein
MPASVATLEKKLHDYEQKLERHAIDSRSARSTKLHSKADLNEWIAKTKTEIEKAKERESKRPYKHMPQEQDGGRRKTRKGRKSRRGTRRA